MNDCYANIIGIRPNCEVDNGTEPTSGYYIQDYVGINIKSAANIADGEMLSGLEYLTDLRRRAMVRLQNDILRYINTEFKVNSIQGEPWSTTKKVRGNSLGILTDNDKRGIVLEKKRKDCKLQSIFIHSVTINIANDESDATFYIADATNNQITTFSGLTLYENVDNEFVINRFFKGNEIQIYMLGDMNPISVDIHCNCGGESSSPCVNVKGMLNTTLTKSEGYGITASVSCRCNFESLLCDLKMDQVLGQAAFELIGGMFYDEMSRTSRFNWLTIYNKEEIIEQSQAAFKLYADYFMASMAGLRSYIEAAGPCGCIDCGGMQVKYNI